MKPSVKSSGRKPVPQPHGGALVPGAGGGPQPGSGRPPSALRRTLRESLEERINILGEIADDQNARASDRIRAVDMLLKYGLGTRECWDRESVIDLTQELGCAVRRHVDDEAALEAIKDEWITILRSRSG